MPRADLLSRARSSDISPPVGLLPFDHAVLDEAASIDPMDVWSIDALHLATALSIREEIGLFVTYDERLSVAAAGHGLPVFAAGVDQAR